jgi:hypothetical protein
LGEARSGRWDALPALFLSWDASAWRLIDVGRQVYQIRRKELNVGFIVTKRWRYVRYVDSTCAMPKTYRLLRKVERFKYCVWDILKSLLQNQIGGTL